MIIETRYRDIPWEEFQKCVPDPTMTREEWDRVRRGKPITIHVPARQDTGGLFKCRGPLFEVTRRSKLENHWVAVCPHIAEIGD